MDFQIEFLKKLEDIYLGRIKNLEGNSGYINLIYIKSQYYQDIIKILLRLLRKQNSYCHIL